MKKILLSVLAIALTVGVVSGTAYALFTDTASVNGITFTSGNADLRVALDNANSGPFGTPFGESQTFSNALNSYLFGYMYPGYENWGYFRLDNNSASAIPLTLTGQLKNGVSGNWVELKDKIQVKMTKGDGNYLTEWYTLDQWNSAPRSLGSLDIDETLTYRIYVRVLAAGNEIANKTLSSVQFDFVGTQQ
jgi:predicted ribosomally synthesized peptide with SipW-like signal peptide